jgi:hypothetical protein
MLLSIFSCNNAGDKSAKVEEKDYSDFAVLYAYFQKYIADDDIVGLKTISSEYIYEFLDNNYETHVTPEMKKVIAETPADKVEEIDGRKLIQYSVIYGENAKPGEDFTSAYGFWFEKIDGCWKVTEPHMAG